MDWPRSGGAFRMGMKGAERDASPPSACGSAPEIGRGRHPISSAYFWYVKSPCGGLAEYCSNEDVGTERWRPAAFWPSPETFAEWAIAGGIDGHTRRQARREKKPRPAHRPWECCRTHSHASAIHPPPATLARCRPPPQGGRAKRVEPIMFPSPSKGEGRVGVNL